MGKAIKFSGYSKSDLLIPFAISVIVTPSFCYSQIVSKFPILVQSLPLFVFYSFDYTVKSRGVCNRLPVLRRNTTICLTYVLPVLDAQTCSSCLDFLFPVAQHLPRVYIEALELQFTLKLLGQFHTLQKLTNPNLAYLSFLLQAVFHDQNISYPLIISLVSSKVWNKVQDLQLVVQ